jgi:hypothetical protein
MATVKKTVKKAQPGKKVKPTADSTKYYQDDAKLKLDVAQTQSKFGLKKASEESAKEARKSMVSASRQKLKGKPGYDANGNPIKKQKSGGKTMMKRADGSTSQRGLWDNIRAAKGSGKKPTAQMLKQEKKIKAASKKK